MKYTVRSGWKPVLKHCKHWERSWFLATECFLKKRELEEEANRRCVRSSLGIADCRDLRVSITLARWWRHSRRLYAEFILDCSWEDDRRTVYVRSKPQ